MASKVLETCQSKHLNPRIPFVFEKFPSQPSIKALLHGPFRDNVRVFLLECAEIQEYTVSGMPIWSTLLTSVERGFKIRLYIIEETVENSLNPFCDNCRLTGWGHHFVSKRKYHFIIPDLGGLKKQQRGNILKLRTHVLYGLVHGNGFGHLICIDGRQWDSHSLSDTQVMDFWDRLCTTLKTREVSVQDEINLRLLLLAVNDQPWYSRWGYEFRLGTCGVPKELYETQVEYVMSLGLEEIVSDLKREGKGGRKIRKIIDKYRELVDVELITLRDLLRFMMEFQSRVRIKRKMDKKRKITNGGPDVMRRRKGEEAISSDKLAMSLGQSCRWAAKRIKFVLDQIMTVLQKNQGSDCGKACISRQELRDEIRKCVGDTGLIDFVLKSITRFKMGNHIVCRSFNSSARRFEFKIHKVCKDVGIESIRFPSYPMNSSWKEPGEGGDKVAAEAIVNISSTRSCQELHDKAMECSDEAELVDLVVNSTGSSFIKNEMVYCPKTQSIKHDDITVQDSIKIDAINIEEWNVVQDALYLCRNILLSYYSDPEVVWDALDSKNFVKEWRHKEQDWKHLMTVECKLLPSFDELETELQRPLTPGEMVLVSPSMTISELKVVAQAALRDTYCIMNNFVVNQIGGLKETDPEKVVSCTIEPGMTVWVRGSGLDFSTILRYEDDHHKLNAKCKNRRHPML